MMLATARITSPVVSSEVGRSSPIVHRDVAPSNVMILSFKSLHPADAPKYLKAIIAAYKDELSGVFEDASTRQLKLLDEEIARPQPMALRRLGELERGS